MLIDITKITYKEFTEIKKKYSKIGRPLKYKTQEERIEANKSNQRIWHKKHDKIIYQRKKNKNNKSYPHI